MDPHLLSKQSSQPHLPKQPKKTKFNSKNHNQLNWSPKSIRKQRVIRRPWLLEKLSKTKHQSPRVKRQPSRAKRRRAATPRRTWVKLRVSKRVRARAGSRWKMQSRLRVGKRQTQKRSTLRSLTQLSKWLSRLVSTRIERPQLHLKPIPTPQSQLKARIKLLLKTRPLKRPRTRLPRTRPLRRVSRSRPTMRRSRVLQLTSHLLRQRSRPKTPTPKCKS